MPVAGDEAEARLVQRRAAMRPVMSRAVERRPCRSWLAQPDDRLDQLVLAVAGDAGDPKISPARTSKVDAVHGLVAAIVRDVQVVDARAPAAPGWRLAAVDGELDVAADHQLGEVVLVRLARARLPTTLPRRMTVIRSAISSTS